MPHSFNPVESFYVKFSVLFNLRSAIPSVIYKYAKFSLPCILGLSMDGFCVTVLSVPLMKITK